MSLAYAVVLNPDQGNLRIAEVDTNGSAYNTWINGQPYSNWWGVAGPFSSLWEAQSAFPMLNVMTQLDSVRSVPDIGDAGGSLQDKIPWVVLFVGIIVIAISHGRVGGK